MAANRCENIYRYRRIRRCVAALCILELLDEDERNWTRGKTRPWIRKRKERGYFTNIVRELKIEDTAGYKEMMRMNYEDFKTLLRYIEKDISPSQVIGGHKVITAAERLTLALRFLATGESYRSLSFHFRISRSAISYIIKDVSNAINQHVAADYLKVPSAEQEWLEIANLFQEKWQYPHCIGAIDGKHICIQPPPNSGSYFYNYEQTHSIVLLAVAGPDYECLYADIGTNGRISDGGIWNKCGLSLAIEANELSLPTPDYLPGNAECLPYVLVGDDAFALKTYLMKPYPQKGLSAEKRVYNYRHSRARRISENRFGILVNRRRFLKTTLQLPPETVESLTNTALTLHNYLRKSFSRNVYCPPGLCDSEDSNGDLIPGQWRQDSLSLAPLCVPAFGHNSSNQAKVIRDAFIEYFCTDGALKWQWERC